MGTQQEAMWRVVDQKTPEVIDMEDQLEVQGARDQVVTSAFLAGLATGIAGRSFKEAVKGRSPVRNLLLGGACVWFARTSKHPIASGFASYENARSVQQEHLEARQSAE